ncbi:hypothetical protein GGC64_004561 [Mycobacterium sp. OAS707]|uniref:hypothetical protein n=1 Tax=Mycobacterium sp. OAS707 TaxID=2663822 RepID=UPI00178BDFB2|nr:hypothetical protein [Mycobacterium sp. OAS707]MBE1550521.1 hypothetical protein [Mycobacterium sp. OAS707]
MRSAAVVLAALVLVGWGAPTASATSAPPEVADVDGVAFTDNSSIVDPRPVPVESWSRVGSERAVAVHFTSGTPACNGVHATAQETADAVTVTLTGGSLPSVPGRMCIMLAVTGTLVVPLSSPLGDRQVLSAV